MTVLSCSDRALLFDSCADLVAPLGRHCRAGEGHMDYFGTRLQAASKEIVTFLVEQGVDVKSGAAPGPLHIVPFAIFTMNYITIAKQLDTRQAWDNFYDDPLEKLQQYT